MKDKPEKKKKDTPATNDGSTPINKKKKKIPVPVPEPKEITELNEFLQDLYKSLNPETVNRVTKKQNDIDPMMIKNILSEYMSCFAVLGYDINGNRIIIKWSPNDQAEDSLVELVRLIFVNIASGYGSSGPSVDGN